MPFKASNKAKQALGWLTYGFCGKLPSCGVYVDINRALCGCAWTAGFAEWASSHTFKDIQAEGY